MKKGDKVLTPEGQLATVLKTKNGEYIVWVYITLDIDRGWGRLLRYPKTSLQKYDQA